MADKQPKTMKIRVTKANQHELSGVMRMMKHALVFAGIREIERSNVMSLMAGAMGEDAIGEYILVPLPQKAAETTTEAGTKSGEMPKIRLPH